MRWVLTNHITLWTSGTHETLINLCRWAAKARNLLAENERAEEIQLHREFAAPDPVPSAHF